MLSRLFRKPWSGGRLLIRNYPLTWVWLIAIWLPWRGDWRSLSLLWRLLCLLRWSCCLSLAICWREVQVKWEWVIITAQIFTYKVYHGHFNPLWRILQAYGIAFPCSMSIKASFCLSDTYSKVSALFVNLNTTTGLVYLLNFLIYTQAL